MRRLLLATLIAAVPVVALANGAAIPESATFHAESPSANDLMMNTTFGFIFTTDGGANWHWTCHEAVLGMAAFTPRAARSPDGSAWVMVPLGLAVDPSKPVWRSTNDGCDWSPIATLASNGVLAVAFDSTGAHAIAAGTDGTVTHALAWRSTDGGATFSAPVLSKAGANFTSAAIAPSDPQRMYVTSFVASPAAAAVFRSDNGGDSWTELSFPFVGQATTRLLGVSPVNPDVVWLRNDAASDRVLVSTNGAVSFTAVFTANADVIGFAMTNNGATQWIATRSTSGVFVSSAGGPFVRSVGSPSAPSQGDHELSARGNTVYGAANVNSDPWAAASTTDGAVWSTAMSFARIVGPQSCPVGSSSATICDALWPGIEIKIHPATPTPTPNPTPTPPHSPGKDCKCDVASPASPLAAGPLLLGLAVLAIARRSRARAR